MRAKISYAKFTALLHKHGYIASTVYFEVTDGKRAVVFFECRLPKTQKYVLIHVPRKYLMVLPNDVNPRSIEIVEANEGANALTERSVSYLLDVRGPLIESDLVVISSDGMCHSKFNGTTLCYFLASNLPQHSDEEDIMESDESSDDEVKELETAMRETKRKLQSKGVSVPVSPKIEAQDTEDSKESSGESPADEEVHKDSNDDSGESSPDEGVELVFVDEEVPEDTPRENTEDSDGGLDSNAEGSEDDVEDDEESESDEDDSEESDSDEDSESDEDSDEDSDPKGKSRRSAKELRENVQGNALSISRRSNHVDINELDVSLGIIYVSVDINEFYRNVASFENEALSVYEQIDDNERDMRESRVSEIKKQMELAINHLDLRVRQIQSNEKGMQYQLLRLTAILQDAENVRNKAQSKAKSRKGNINTDPEVLEIERVYNRTRKTVHEMNMSLMRQRDDFEDVLTNYEESLKELFEL